MNLRDARDSYYECSAKLSEIVRQLSFAGIAVIWMFRVGSDTADIAFATILVWPLFLLVTALALDLIQYLYGSLAWSIFAHRQERQGRKDDEEVKPDEIINWPALAFFYGKVVLCVAAYGFLILFLRGKL